MDLALAIEISDLAGKYFIADLRMVGLIQHVIKREWPSSESRGWRVEVTDKEARKVIRWLRNANAQMDAMKSPPKPRRGNQKKEEADAREELSRRIAHDARTFDPLTQYGSQHK